VSGLRPKGAQNATGVTPGDPDRLTSVGYSHFHAGIVEALQFYRLITQDHRRKGANGRIDADRSLFVIPRTPTGSPDDGK
jgi:hypothetical protein